MTTLSELKPGALVWMLEPPDRWSRHGIVREIDGDVIRVEHGTERHEKQLTWFNREKLATPMEWSQIQAARKRAKRRPRRD